MFAIQLVAGLVGLVGMAEVAQAMPFVGGSIYTGSIHDNLDTVNFTNANAGRVELCWRYLVSDSSPVKVDLSLTISKVRSTPSLVSDWLESEEVSHGLDSFHGWLSTLDSIGVEHIVGALFDGGLNCLPRYGPGPFPSRTGSFDPNNPLVPESAYLAYAYLTSRALARNMTKVRGTKGAPGWQAENEPNHCWIDALGGLRSNFFDSSLQRSRGGRGARSDEDLRRSEVESVVVDSVMRVRKQVGLGEHGNGQWRKPFVALLFDDLHKKGVQPQEFRAILPSLVGVWANATFIQSVISAVREGVRDELCESTGPEEPSAASCEAANVAVNFFTDIPVDGAAIAGMPTWQELAKEWEGVYDVLAVDVYPNYFGAFPPNGSAVGDVVAEAGALMPGVPVWVMETGYCVQHSNETNGRPMVQMANFSEHHQATYFQDAVTSADAAGASGFLAFGIWKDTGIPVPTQGYTQDDNTALSFLHDIVTQNLNQSIQFAEWCTLNLDYCATTLPRLVVNITGHWGVFDQTNNPLPAAVTLRNAYRKARSQQ